MESIGLFITTLLFLQCYGQETGTGIECYQCSSVEPNKSCKDPLPKNATKAICTEDNSRNILNWLHRSAVDKALVDAFQSTQGFNCITFTVTANNGNGVSTYKKDCIKAASNLCDTITQLESAQNNKISECKQCVTANCNGTPEDIPDSSNNLQNCLLLSLIMCFFAYILK